MPCCAQGLDAALIHQTDQLLKNEKQVTLHQRTDTAAHSSEDAETRSIGDGLLFPLLFLLGLPFFIIAATLLLWMMHRADGLAHTLWMVPTWHLR